MASPSDNQQDDVRVFYKEISTFLRTQYNPHFNLYQKQCLSEKIKCYEQNPNEPSKYYECIAQIDERMILNSSNLQQRFNSIEVEKNTYENYQENDKECQDRCNKSNREDVNQRNACIKKCLTNMKEQCITLQNQFYESILRQNPEYKKIKTL